MSPLPPPPASVLDPVGTTERAEPRVALRAGQLTPAWRVVYIVGWVGVLLGFAAVAKSSRTMGLSTWWLGASAEPRFVVVQVLPFLPGVVLVVASARNARFLPFLGMIGALLLAAVATGDLGRFDRLALVEFAIAAAAFVLSVACFAGMLQKERSASSN